MTHTHNTGRSMLSMHALRVLGVMLLIAYCPIFMVGCKKSDSTTPATTATLTTETSEELKLVRSDMIIIRFIDFNGQKMAYVAQVMPRSTDDTPGGQDVFYGKAYYPAPQIIREDPDNKLKVGDNILVWEVFENTLTKDSNGKEIDKTTKSIGGYITPLSKK